VAATLAEQPVRKSVAAVFAAAALAGIAAGSSPATASGWLIGRTQISFGCPGPERAEGPSCNPWRPFAKAHFTVAIARADGTAIPGTSRVIVSDAEGRFRLPLAAGDYAITPLPQGHTRGGPKLKLHVVAGSSAWTLVRFYGYPQML